MLMIEMLIALFPNIILVTDIETYWCAFLSLYMRKQEHKLNGDFVLQLAIVLATPMSARMILKWTGSTTHWTSTVTTKEVACVRTVETTLRVSTVIDAKPASFAHLART